MDGLAGEDGGLSRRGLLGLGVAGVVAAALPGCGGDEPDRGPRRTTGPPDVLALAIDAYVFGYPMIMLDMIRAASGPTNTIDHSGLSDPLDRGVARLSRDMVYSQAWLNLGDEPLVLQIPGMEPDRYWLFQVLDGWGNTVHDLSSKDPRTSADGEGPPYTYVITGPEWSGTVPPRTTRLDMPAATSTIVGRIQINGPEDAPRVNGIQQQIKLIPLSAWQRGEFDRTVSRVHPIDRGPEPPVKRIAALDGRTYLDRLCRLMMTTPPVPADAALMRELAAIGVRPGGTVDGQPTEVLDEAVRQAHRRIADWRDPTARHANGWEIPIHSGAFGTDYLRRAAAALRSPGLAPTRDVLYATLWSAPATDEQGRPLRYRLRFARDQWPPVSAFASLTAYDPQGFLVLNPDAIYSVGHAPPPVAAPDGSIDIAVQYEDPRPRVPTGNWLPIPPTGDFSLTLRLYAPKEAAIDGTWQPPPLTRAG
ncbi:DUF1254 domain-containing protein [Nocardia rhizosphaerihabitans]|uniref:DUF1254 domain-containing protein n=1 Tax=Nocardia rhizosphaerihabitans TaxID=1691570 RepID=A0ABQ2K9S6_9NOCA|nr:DUF1254 domain-containing protein [Nocardia rhizosphaerihabitans]GGN73739.1 hypothetical protein GCM10011610_16560 [Nocardia rhizosphaerihabitans]